MVRSAMQILLLTPPMTQLNTPYPATAYLTGCLRRHAPALSVVQGDFSLELFLRLFSRGGVQAMLDELSARARKLRSRAAREAMPDSIAHFLAHGDDYATLVEPVLRFLQGNDPSLALRIVGRSFLPEGPRFASLSAPAPEGDDPDALHWAFGELGVTDRARHLASLFIDDLADVIRDGIDPRFELCRASPICTTARPARRRTRACRLRAMSRCSLPRAASSPASGIALPPPRLDADVRGWFDMPPASRALAPGRGKRRTGSSTLGAPQVPPDLIRRALHESA